MMLTSAQALAKLTRARLASNSFLRRCTSRRAGKLQLVFLPELSSQL